MTDVIEALPLIWDWTWRTSLQVCVLICLIRIVQLLFRKTLTPRWHYALWMLVLIRMVMPIGLEAPWSVFNLFKTDPPVQTQTLTPLPAYDWVMESMAQPIYFAPPTEQTQFDLGTGLSLTWLAGFALLTIHLLRQWTRLRKLVAQGEEIRSPEVLGLLHTCARAIGIKNNPPIIECALPVPGLYGFLRPKLLMPNGLTNSLTKDELRFIILHELAHYKRHDLTVNWLMTLMQIVHWFNPLVWYAFMRMRTDRELACDALALSHANSDDPEAYGKTLLKLMDQNHGLRPIPGMIGILENHAHLKRRIIAIARFTTKSYKWSIPALIILAIIGSVTLTQAVQEEKLAKQDDSEATEDSSDTDVSETSEPDPELVKKLNKSIGIVFEDIHIEDLTNVISKSYKIEIDLDQTVIAPKPDPELEGLPVSSSAAAKTEPPHDPNVVTNGIISYINVKGVTLREALKAITLPLNLSFAVNGDKVTISSVVKIRTQFGSNPENQEIPRTPNLSGSLKKLLNNKIDFDPLHMPLKDALEALSDKAEINLVNSYPTEPETNNVQMDKKQNTPANQVLSEILTQASLTYQPDGNLIWIVQDQDSKQTATPEEQKAALEIILKKVALY